MILRLPRSTLVRRDSVIIEAWRERLGLMPLAGYTLPNPLPPLHSDHAAKLGVGLFLRKLRERPHA